VKCIASKYTQRPVFGLHKNEETKFAEHLQTTMQTITQTIATLDDPRIALYRNLRGTPATHSAERVFVTEGYKLTSKLLYSGLEVVSLFALPAYYDRLRREHPEQLLRLENTPERLLTASAAIMHEIVGFRLHEGIMALAKQPPERLLNECSLAELAAHRSPIVALCGVVDSENVGSIVRNCAAFGVSALVTDAATSSPYLRRAVRVSMGGIFAITVFSSQDLCKSCQTLKEQGWTIVGAELTPDAIALHHFQFPARSVVIVGSEGRGIPDTVLSVCDVVVAVPMHTTTLQAMSLNVSAASAVLLYAARFGSLQTLEQ